ncbi:energy-coupling factor ABC transporter ATP-binding protein [Lactococcus sp. LG606]|uniref:energy-coupling factor ABC transporter ATP-binding protein n=1 Tax=Lactococcus sp. LG606 TaxID=2816912 RepID=UPI001A8F78E2|nr:ABC transporter ATP-binding protein [Lactococcus sp. LG606]QSR13551.1 ABC transporter ATP-binding protein [Lactococcus sp. LG606]
MSYLELKNVSYSYPNGFEAIKNVDLSFERGEPVAIIGQNGAGKTTTVKLMNGLLKPTQGHVYVDGKLTQNMTTAQVSKFVGYVFQNPDEQIFQETIYKEIAYGLIYQKLAPHIVKERVIAAAKLCQLESVLEEHPYNLPYSKRKFVTIASIIALDTEVIILDEPTAGQDRLSIDLLGEIIQYLQSQNKTVITITHDMEFVVQQFMRVIVFADKMKRKDSTPAEVFQDKALLNLASLKEPYILQLAKMLGHEGVLTIEELLMKEFK